MANERAAQRVCARSSLHTVRDKLELFENALGAPRGMGEARNYIHSQDAEKLLSYFTIFICYTRRRSTV